MHRELERAIAEFIGTEAAIVFVGGHSTNESTIGHLVGPGDLILHDCAGPQQHRARLASCPAPGGGPSRTTIGKPSTSCWSNIRGEYRRVLLAIEGVYSMDGDFPDLPQFIEVKKRHKALLMVDEAHSTGVLGATAAASASISTSIRPTSISGWAR